MGTAYYMSPEQMMGKKSIDHRADLWAIGVLVCECLSGVRPFDGETWAELVLNICSRPLPLPSAQGVNLPGFDAWFARATAREPEQRFASAQELVNALAPVLSSRVSGTLALSPERESAHDAEPKTVAAPPATGALYSALPAERTLLETPAPTTGGAVEIPLRLSPARRPARTAVVVGAATLLLGSVAAWLALGARSSDAGTVAREPPSASQAVAASPAPPVTLEPLPTPASEPPTPPTPSPPVVKPRAEKPALASAPPLTLPPASPPQASPKPAASPPAQPAAAASAAPRLRCYVDPFTGQIRAGAPASSPSFACKQNPFTGGYQRL
jgi:serine/threonine-protein kinase